MKNFGCMRVIFIDRPLALNECEVNLFDLEIWLQINRKLWLFILEFMAILEGDENSNWVMATNFLGKIRV